MSQKGRVIITRPPMALHDLDKHIEFLQSRSIENSTRSGYSTGARSYLNFCKAHNLSIRPTPITLARYIAYTSRSIASGTKYLTGARHFLLDEYPEFDASRSSALVHSVIAGSRKVRADPVRRKQPLRLEHLLAYEARFSSNTSFDDLLFLVILACCFFGCHRLGELVASTAGAFDTRKTIKRSSLKVLSKYISYWLPYHKGDRFYAGTDILVSAEEAFNPLRLMERYIALRDPRFGAHPELFVCEDGGPPTRSWFEKRFFSTTITRAQFGGHSIRAGRATHLASLGLSETIIQAMGRWSSEAWKIYIRDNPTVRAELMLAHQRNRRI